MANIHGRIRNYNTNPLYLLGQWLCHKRSKSQQNTWTWLIAFLLLCCTTALSLGILFSGFIMAGFVAWNIYKQAATETESA